MARLVPLLRTGFGFLFRWLAQNILRVAGWVIGTGLLFFLGVGGLSWYLMKGEPTAAQWSAAGVVATGSVVVGLLAGLALAAVATLGAWVRGADLGGLVSKAVFSQTLSVTDRRPAGRGELAESLNGATIGEVKQRLSNSFGEVFTSGALDRWLPAQGRWLLAKIINTAAWYATRSVIDRIPGSDNDKHKIDLLSLRNEVGNEIEDRAVGFVGLRAKLFAWAVIGIGVLVVLISVAGLRVVA